MIGEEKQDALAQAARGAVEASTDEMASIIARVGRLTDLLRTTAEGVREAGDGDESSSRFSEQLDETVEKLGNLFDRQSEALRTFNIVMFGRTGAGKSTLISAMTRGNGASVSQGESDWTTQVEPLDWHACRIYDTPGINGWGRTESRDDLEARAREAVEVADFVIVCFDSQSQQADEFAKLAAWVKTYRKPILAVLNPRNPVWRLPPRVPIGTARSNLSRAVREHAANIRDELAKIGLSGVPVVAVSSKRALFARASIPFQGPDGLSLEKQREQFGVESLERWSGFPRLEELLVEAISSHAVTLRIGALNDQLRGVLRELRTALAEIEDEAEVAAKTIETDLVGAILRLLGYPPRSDRDRRAAFLVDYVDVLAELERCRGGAFQAPAEGEFRQLVRQRLDAELGTLRSRSLQEAEECVVGAFERGTKLTADAVKKASFDEARMKAAAESVLEEGVDYLNKRIEVARRDAELDLEVLTRAVSVGGDTGTGWKYSSWGMKAGGILAGAAGAFGTLALTNIWNPLGWAAGLAFAVSTIGAVAATVLGWLGGKSRKKAEKKRLAARRQALADVRKNVHHVYDAFRDEVLERTNEHAVSASADLLLPPIQHALMLRRIQQKCRSLGDEIGNLTGELRETDDPQGLLWEVATELEKNAYPETPNRGRLHWLGEDWVSDPEGLRQAEGSANSERTSAYDPGFFNRLFDGIKDIFEQITEDLDPGAGRSWLADALAECSDDPEAMAALEELSEFADDGRPRIHLVGDYNAGKSSFIKRLLLDAGSPAPETLEIRANPTTDRAREYDWDGVRLIDSPGFQSGQETHTEHALRTFPDASAVIYLFQPNLVLGDDADLLKVLRGDESLGLVAKQERTFFVVNRSDELGVDPETDPEAFSQLADRKKTELALALGARGVEIEPTSVFCMASDPFGLVGNRTDVDSTAFDAFRAWDGFDRFMGAFRQSRRQLLRAGVDRSVLEGGLARLSRLEARREAEVEQLRMQDDAYARLQMLINEAISEGARLGSRQRADLERLVDEHAAGFRDEVLSEQDPDLLRLKAVQFSQWWEDKPLQVELAQWAKRTAEELNSWREKSFEAIERRLESPEFHAAFGKHEEESPEQPEGAHSGWFRKSFHKVGRQLGGATRDVVYKIGKALGFKFKPWGAVKLGKLMGRVGAVMSVVGVGIDIADFVLSEKRIAERERARKEVAVFLRESVPRVVEAVAYGDDDDPGILNTLDESISVLRDLESEQTERREELEAALAQARGRIGTYAALRDDACEMLGNPWE